MKAGLNIWLLMILSVCSKPLLAQQTATVLGTIRDASNEQPIEFVTVFIKGTGNAVSTDERGNFALQVPAEQRLTL